MDTVSSRVRSDHISQKSPRVLAQHGVSLQAILAALQSVNRLTADGERCPTCTATLRHAYCAYCGERSPAVRPRSVIGFIREGVSRLFDADNRLLRSLSVLILQPGRLTRSYLQGNRKPYLSPVQIFAVVNIAFVIFAVNVGPDTFRTPLQYHVGSSNFYHQEVAQRWVNASIGAPAEWDYQEALALRDSLGEGSSAADAGGVESGQDVVQSRISAFEDVATRFNRQANRLSESLIFLFIPGLALWFWLLHRLFAYKRTIGVTGTGLLPHVVHATHVMATMLIVFVGVVGLMIGILGLDVALGWNVASIQFGYIGIFDLLLFSAEAVYLGYSFRGAWGIARLRAAIAGGATVFMFFHLLLVYRAILFVTVFTTMAE